MTKLEKTSNNRDNCKSKDYFFDISVETVSGLREFLNQYARFATDNAKYVSAQVVKNAEDRLIN